MRSNLESIVLAVALVLPLSSMTAYAADATTGLQVVQNANLIRQLAQQTKLVSGQIKDYAQQIAQYNTMLLNLRNVPTSVINETVAPYRQQLNDLKVIQDAVIQVMDSSRTADRVYTERLNEIERLKMDPAEYFRNEFSLAEAKGGYYQQKLDEDMKAIQDVQTKAAALNKLEGQIHSFEGNIEGLKTLAQQSNVAATELVSMNYHFQKMAAEEHQRKIDEQNQKAQNAKRSEQIKDSLQKTMDAERAKRLEGFNSGGIDFGF